MSTSYIVSETITQVFKGPTCWVIYGHPAFNGPVKSNLYAVVNCEYDDETKESFISPVITSKDGLMTWANYFDSFVGVIHQEERPTENQVESFKKEIEETEQEIKKLLSQSMQQGTKKNTETNSTIKFQPKKKPSKPESDD